MTATVKVWDKAAKDGAPLEMYSVRAREACKRDPERYSLTEHGSEPVAALAPAVPYIPPPPAEPEPITEGWEGLPWPARRKLAVQLGAARNCNSEIANAIIAAEVTRRADAQSKPEPVFEPLPGED